MNSRLPVGFSELAGVTPQPSPAELAGVLTDAQKRAIPARTGEVDDTLDAVVAAATPDPVAVYEVAGPLGGAAQRFVSAWAGPW